MTTFARRALAATGLLLAGAAAVSMPRFLGAPSRPAAANTARPPVTMVKVSDGRAESEPADIKVEVLKAGVLPVAVALAKPNPIKAAQKGNRDDPDILVLSGEKSQPGAGDGPLTYQWRQVSGLDLKLRPSDLAKNTVGLRIFRPGTYRFSLVVSDGQNQSAPAQVDVEVLEGTKATDAGAAPKPDAATPAPVEDPRNAAIRAKLQRKVTFEFVDTPLDEGLNFIRSLANVTMIVDPKVLAGGAPTINLRVTDMSLDLALEWILKLADLEYGIEDGVLVIAKPNMAKPKPAAAPAPAAGPEEPWVQDTRKRLTRRVSFEFVDTPLEETLQFLNSLTKVNIILDPKAAAEGVNKTPITLRVQDLEMGTALKWLLRLAGLRYEFRNQAVFITRDDKPAGQGLELAPMPAPRPRKQRPPPRVDPQEPPQEF
jgi:hypothetical protein